MVQENRRKIAKLLSFLVSLTGVLVMLGWIFDIGVLKSIHPSWISMKFDTALCFFLSGIMLFYIFKAQEGEFDMAQIVISTCALMIILLMGILFFASFLKVQTGIEHLFLGEPSGGVKTVIPGRPSMPTMLNFLLLALAGMLSILHVRRLRLSLLIIGILVAAVGLVAVTGYLIDFPVLYYYIAGVNSAMALHTALLFVLLGVGLICL